MVINMKKIRHKRDGFTLLEMLAVLFIIGIVFSITLPTFGPIMGTLKLTTASENIANALESARQYASTSGQGCRVVFPTTGDLSYRSYKLYGYNNTEGSWNPIGKAEVLPNNIQIGRNSYFSAGSMSAPYPYEDSPSQTAAYVEFESDGSAKGSGRIYITDLNSNAFQKITYSGTPRKVYIKEIGDDSE